MARDALGTDSGFVVSVGVECSAPVVEGGFRQDQLRLTGHWERYAEDLALARSLGIDTLRYGIPFHVVAADPGRLDWDWTDRALGTLLDLGLEPIADLMHFGLPDDLWGINDPALLPRFRAFVEGFVARYPAVRCWTPVNEPWITAALSTTEACWNERIRTQEAQANAIVSLAECIVEASAIIRAAHPDAVFLQSDACERWVPGSDDPAVHAEAELRNAQRFVGFQLAYGREPLPVALDWLLRSGITERRLAALLAKGSDHGAIVGHDYYIGNFRDVFAPGRSRSFTAEGGYAELAREFHEVLGLPFYLAETNRETSDAIAWLTRVWGEVREVAAEGLPIRGLCWYGLVDMIDWDTALRLVQGHVCDVGLFDLERHPRPVSGLVREIVRQVRAGELVPGERPAA